MTLLSRLLLVLGGVIGAAGVAAAAAASHGNSRDLSALATIFLAHAPVLVAIGLHGRGRAILLACGVLGAGTLFFGGDLALRHWTGHGLFAGAAPLGGVVMVLGWLALSLAGALSRRQP